MFHINSIRLYGTDERTLSLVHTISNSNSYFTKYVSESE